MKIIKTLLTISLFIPSLCLAEQVQDLVGYWKSSKGAIYKSDGSNLVCTFIPNEHRAEYSHWINKNRLEITHVYPNCFRAHQILWQPDGTRGINPIKVTITEDTLIFESTYKNSEGAIKTRITKFTRYTEKDIEPAG